VSFVGLLEALGRPQYWTADAICAQVGEDFWHPERGGITDDTRAAKRVCLSCPVKQECLDYALERDEPFGIWGGLTARERRRQRRGSAA
jgi:WhiB family redox-sensing transcriptional regulator